MSLVKKVRIARRFQRSVRVDTDLSDRNALEGFVCPASSAGVLVTMSHQIIETGHTAFTWTGPYGTGKSSLALALSVALGGSAKRRAEAADVIGRSLAKTLWKALPPMSKGWRILPVTCQRAPIARLVGDALTAHGYAREGDKRRWTDDRVMSTLTELSLDDPKNRGGLVVILDEMGKLLEGAAQENLDIFFLQQLAETAVRSQRRILVVGILHQAFDGYAQRLSREARDEWAKVQGRFLDMTVSPAGDEQLDLLTRAIQSERIVRRPTNACQAVATVVQQARPGAPRHLAVTLEHCWPLHPVTACLLGPLSRRRFGQNQRSLFGFLNSGEPFGFQDFLRDAGKDDLYRPDRLWDYLRTNLEPSILASPDGHRWSMCVEAIERGEAFGASPAALGLLKTIALVDLFRERSGLEASRTLLGACVTGSGAEAEADEALKQLQGASLIVYRKHLGAYSIYAGSDFDIERAVGAALSRNEAVDFRQLRSLAGLQPILAKRHYHETGALRWFDVDLVPISEASSHATPPVGHGGAIGRVLLAIPASGETKAQAGMLCRTARDAADGLVVIGLADSSWRTMDLARGFLAVTKVAEEQPELGGDAVARREVMARLVDVRLNLENALQGMMDSARWFFPGEEVTHLDFAQLNSRVSDFADERYSQSPKLTNELLNRERPSSNAVAAEKDLLKRMVQHEGDLRLGIAGYPAEGGLFDSLLLKPGLYRKAKAEWSFAAPRETADPCRLMPAWQAAIRYLEEHSDAPVSVSELYGIWQEPPFGIKRGLLPLLTTALVLARRDVLACYRDGVFQAAFTDLDVDSLMADPSSIALRWMNLDRASKQALAGLAGVVNEFSGQGQGPGAEPIEVARGLVAVYSELRPWAKRTTRISETALRMRNIFKQAADPNRFLFDDIPSLLETPSDDPARHDGLGIVKSIRDGLRELTQAYPAMLARLQALMLAELHVPDGLPHSLEELRARARNVQQLSGDFRLNAFVGRITQFHESDEDMEGIASLAMNKPPRDWVDADLDQASLEIADLAQKFLRVEIYARVAGRAEKRQAIAMVIGVAGRPTPLCGDFEIMDTDRPAITDLVERVEEVLLGAATQKRDVVLATLAEISARYLAPAEKDVRETRRRKGAHA